MKKVLAIGIMLLFIGMTISSATEINLEKQSTRTTLDGNILYVGGNGTGNYSKIQDAISDSSEGDTVYVYDDSSPYYENLKVNKSITLKGENRDSTVINGSGSKYIVNISTDDVTISGFTLIGYNYSTIVWAVYSNYTTISDNIFLGNKSYGINIFVSNYCNITDNIIYCDEVGIDFYYCNNNSISNNIITTVYGTGFIFNEVENSKIFKNSILGCFDGIGLVAVRNINISENNITNNHNGIFSFYISNNITVYQNNIEYNKNYGIILVNSYNDKIIQNNLIGNGDNAYFIHLLVLSFLFRNTEWKHKLIPKIEWNGNYWNETGQQSYIIPGTICLAGIIFFVFMRLGINKLPITYVNFDRNPAQEPYDIPMV